MIGITLTQFVDFVLKSGTLKLTAVRNVKKQHAERYHPMLDFYKPIRDEIVEMHTEGRPVESLNHLTRGLSDSKKQTAYPALITGYRKFAGRKSFIWFTPPKKSWIVDDLSVMLNPELGLKFDGIAHLVKLYFKEGEPNKRQVEAMLHLLQTELQPSTGSRKVGILDVRRGKLLLPSTFDPAYLTLMEGEARSFASIYRALPGKLRPTG